MCKAFFEKTVNRNEEGRFIVNLPLKNNFREKIGNSYEIAKRRFLSLEKRLQNNLKLKKDYTKFMIEYESLGHMELVKKETIEMREKACYLPHHAVRNENSLTTKLRVVFDASCKMESGYSLNDALLKGSVI